MSLELLLAGFIAAHTLLLLCFKLGIRRVLCFDAAVDIFATLFLIWMFEGTFSGVMAGAAGGLVISLELMALKRWLGYERPVFDVDNKTIFWERVDGKQK